jgi:hypothetical protein
VKIWEIWRKIGKIGEKFGKLIKRFHLLPKINQKCHSSKREPAIF